MERQEDVSIRSWQVALLILSVSVRMVKALGFSIAYTDYILLSIDGCQ